MSSEIPSSAAIDRQIGLRDSLYDFEQMAWPVVLPGIDFTPGWHIEEVCKHLEAVFSGEIKELVVNVPPGSSKSLLTAVFFPTWSWLRDPSLRFTLVSYSVGLMIDRNGDALRLMQSEWFKQRWGDVVSVPDKCAIGEFYNQARGFRYATSAPGGALTGRHCDILIIDDPLKPDEVTKVGLQAILNWAQQTLPSRFKDPASRRIVTIMQRLHEDDLSSEFVRKGATHLRLPMLFEAANPCYTSVGGDPRTEENELLCPARFPQFVVDRLKLDMGSLNFAAQYQQRPVPEGGAIFRKEWFRRWDVIPPRFDQLIHSWDLAFRGNDDSDFVCGQIWGRVGSQYYLLDCVHARLDFPQTLVAFEELCKKWPKAQAKLVEAKANGDALISLLSKKIPGIVPITPNKDKEYRANAVAPFFEAGNVFIPPDSVAWTADLIHEAITFPLGKNDDMVDAATQALLWFGVRASRFSEAMKKLRG